MVTITYTSLTTLVNDTSISATAAEQIIDQAINKLATNGATVANLTGVAGAKTGTYSQATAGAILELAAAVYSQTYKSSGAQAKSTGLGALQTSWSTSSGGSAAALQQLAKELANELIDRSIVRT